MQLKMSDLETDRLRLREFRQTDSLAITHWEQNFRTDTFLEFCFRSYREWGMGPWAMQLKEGGVIIGNCGFCRIRYDCNHDQFEYCGEVNYYVAPPYRGKGLATETLRAVLEFGFEDIRLTRIQARCVPENVASERVLQKASLKFERMIAASEGRPAEKLYVVSREDFHCSR